MLARDWRVHSPHRNVPGRRSLGLARAFLAGALAACGGVVPQGHPHQAAAARAELHAIGIDQFLGKAVIATESTDAGVTSVTFDPASGPQCLFGASYAAYLQSTGSDKLLIFLGGGGACWTGYCEATPLPDAGIIPLGPLHVEVETNPFHQFNVLYLPYCDGSVFSGENDVPDPMGERHFHGRRNLSAGYDLLSRLGTINTVVVAGISAGAYGTLYATALARLIYPNANMFVYDDSGPWLQNLADTTDIEARIHDWKFDQMLPPSCADCDGGRGQLTAMMAWLVANDDQLRVGMMSYYEDSVIGDEFNHLTGAQYKQLLLSETGKLRDAHPDRVQRFMLEGTDHVLSLYWPSFVSVNNVSLRDWTASLLDGDPSKNDLLGP